MVYYDQGYSHPMPPENPKMSKGAIISIVLAVATLLTVICCAGVVVYANNQSSAEPEPSVTVSPEASGRLPAPAQTAQSDGAPVLGEHYEGTAYNNTAGCGGELLLHFSSNDAARLAGELQIQSECLVGTGDFTGTLNGKTISLTVTPTDGTYTSYAIEGEVKEDGSMSGTYNVPATQYTPMQKGVWSVRPQQ